MLNQLTIEHFRGFSLFKIDQLTRINLIVGKNNVGKTAILEALFLLSGPNNPSNALKIEQQRGIGLSRAITGSDESPWSMLFYQGARDQKINITGI